MMDDGAEPPVEKTYPGVYVEEIPSGVHTISGVSTSITAFVGFTASGAVNTPVHIFSFAEYEQTFGALAADSLTGYAVNHFFQNGGTEAYVVRVADGAASLNGNLDAKTGIYALENVDIFNLLVMPDATAGAGMTDVLTDAITYCVRRRAFMIIDAPENVSTFQQASTWISSSASSLLNRNVALYFPQLNASDPIMNNVVRTFQSAGAVAGVFARTDSTHGVWKAPAGIDAVISGATGVSLPLTDSENASLNRQGVNCLRNLPGIGTVIWGARTARGADSFADEYKYIPVRRLALFLEESIYRGTQWVVFETNDESLWSQIRLNVGAFMHTLFVQGAFQGSTPKDAYFVKCDKETTTQNDIDLGRVNIVIGFAPLKSAEFVVIQIQQMAGNIQP
jgi:Bacteriophage tail sheath protein